MKNVTFLLVIGMAVFAGRVQAQKVNTDSLKLVSKISEDRLKLGKLQNQVEDKTKEKAETARQAQNSANDNQESANALSSNPQDKSLAKKADQNASKARRDAKKARSAADKLDDLNKEIADQKDKIKKEEDKLAHDFPPAMMPAAAPASAVDTTRHN